MCKPSQDNKHYEGHMDIMLEEASSSIENWASEESYRERSQMISQVTCTTS